MDAEQPSAESITTPLPPGLLTPPAPAGIRSDLALPDAVSTPAVPPWPPAEHALDQPGHPGCGLRELVDLDPLGERAAVGVAQLRGDDGYWFLVGRHRRGKRMAEHVGWATRPTPLASLAKPRLAWLGLSTVPRSVRNTRSSSRGRGGWPGSTQRSWTVAGRTPAKRGRARCWRWWRSARTAKAGRLRMALLALDFTGPTAGSLRVPSAPATPPGRTSTSTMVSSWRNRTVPWSRSRLARPLPVDRVVQRRPECRRRRDPMRRAQAPRSDQ
jgi:hypothetical protein